MSEKARFVDFDAETIHTRDEQVAQYVKMAAMDEKNMPKNFKKEEAKQKWRDENEARGEEAVKNTSTDVRYAEVLCVVMKVVEVGEDDGSTGRNIAFDAMSHSELDVMSAVAETFEQVLCADTVLAGHNIKGFDLGLLLNRFRRFGIRPPTHFPLYEDGRWRGARIYDTMKNAPAKNGLGFVSMDDVCMAYGMGRGKRMEWDGMPMDGSRVAEVYEAGAYEFLLKYCESDVDVNYELFSRMTFDFTYGFGGRREEVSVAIREVRASGLDDTARRLAEHGILDAAGLIPG